MTVPVRLHTWCVMGAMIALLGGCNRPERTTGQLEASNAAAQRQFARGLLLHYGFYADHAVVAFEGAAAIDPTDPLPRWGIALALGPRTNDPDMTSRMERAFNEAKRAVELSEHSPGLALDLVSAVATRYTPARTFDLKSLNRAYADAMRALVAKYRDNDDVATLYAESLALTTDSPWWTDGIPHPDISEALVVLESVLARAPLHVGANHYYIHFMEGTTHPERALPSAKRLEAVAQNIGHLLHMPSHVYMRTGDYRAAVAVNQRAVAADVAGAAGHAHEGVEGMLAAHTREYLAAAAAMTGQSAVALKADTSLTPLLRFQRWDAIIARPPVTRGVGQLEWEIAQVLALTAKGRLIEARRHRQVFAALLPKLPKDTKWWADPLAAFLPLAEGEMDARLKWAHGDHAAAIRLWRQAARAQDGLTRAEAVLSWYHPVRESLGAALYQMGRYAEAEQVFREDLGLNPNNPRSLFGLWHTLVALNRDTDATEAKHRFEQAWRDADIALTLETF
jgi:tetratricopeptide (TPR) repeat protein